LQKIADESGGEVTGDAVCECFAQAYIGVKGPVARTDDSTVRWNRREVAHLPPNAGDAVDPQAVADALARALSAAAPHRIEVSSCEMARTANGEWAAFVSCRAGDFETRYGVGTHANAATAVADALISAVNSFAWEDEARRAAA
jgi:2-isopropylmalate synthase